jgi:hypothetical protein
VLIPVRRTLRFETLALKKVLLKSCELPSVHGWAVPVFVKGANREIQQTLENDGCARGTASVSRAAACRVKALVSHLGPCQQGGQGERHTQPARLSLTSTSHFPLPAGNPGSSLVSANNSSSAGHSAVSHAKAHRLLTLSVLSGLSDIDDHLCGIVELVVVMMSS